MAVAAARWARELRVRGRQRVRGSRASRAGVLVIPVIVFGGHEDLFRLFLGLLRLQRFRLIASFVGGSPFVAMKGQVTTGLKLINV